MAEAQAGPGAVQTYRAYREAPGITALYSAESEAEARAKGLLKADAEFLWSIQAGTPEEAAAIYHLRMGFEPFVPVRPPAPCPGCSAWFHPDGSGVCWRCGRIC